MFINISLLNNDYPIHFNNYTTTNTKGKTFKEYPLTDIMREIKKKAVLQQCKICHKKSFYISQHGLCKNCMMEKIKLARCQIKSKEGPIYEKWKSRLEASLTKL